MKGCKEEIILQIYCPWHTDHVRNAISNTSHSNQ